MIAYYDTGSVVDYLTFPSHAGLVLRTESGRGRDPKTLYNDADACLAKIAKSHQGITSCHTLYEIEGAMYSALKSRAVGIAHPRKMLIDSARPVISQSIKVMDLFRIEIMDLTKDVWPRESCNRPVLA